MKKTLLIKNIWSIGGLMLAFSPLLLCCSNTKDEECPNCDEEIDAAQNEEEEEETENKQCSPPPFRTCRDISGASPPYVSELRFIVPSEFMPKGIYTMNSNNNLDIVEHNCRLYFAFRTGPHHYASEETIIYILSTADELEWKYETEFHLETDLREPRFLSTGGKLYFYFSLLGKNPLAFEPQGIMVSELKENGRWSKPEKIYKPDFILWRAREIDGVPYIIGYTGGNSIYNQGEEIPQLETHWLTTKDGRTLEPVIPNKAAVMIGGGSEADFAFTEEGALIAVSRNEAGDETGFGSKICRAEKEALGEWKCVKDPKKYDSPLVFAHKDKIYLIGRRNLTESGAYDLGMDDLPVSERKLKYEIDYWKRPKRCSLWEVNPETLEVTFLIDLPSAGDTCFASATQICENQYLVYNYTSPLEEPDVIWSEGQKGKTYIYSAVLTLP